MEVSKEEVKKFKGVLKKMSRPIETGNLVIVIYTNRPPIKGRVLSMPADTGDLIYITDIDGNEFKAIMGINPNCSYFESIQTIEK